MATPEDPADTPTPIKKCRIAECFIEMLIKMAFDDLNKRAKAETLVLDRGDDYHMSIVHYVKPAGGPPNSNRFKWVGNPRTFSDLREELRDKIYSMVNMHQAMVFHEEDAGAKMVIVFHVFPAETGDTSDDE